MHYTRHQYEALTVHSVLLNFSVMKPLLPTWLNNSEVDMDFLFQKNFEKNSWSPVVTGVIVPTSEGGEGAALAPGDNMPPVSLLCSCSFVPSAQCLVLECS